MKTGWTFEHYGGPESLYVYLRPPGSTEPLRLPCAGLGPSHFRTLRGLVRGDEVPQELVRALGALSRHEVGPVAASDPRNNLLDILGSRENRRQSFK